MADNISVRTHTNCFIFEDQDGYKFHVEHCDQDVITITQEFEFHDDETIDIPVPMMKLIAEKFDTLFDQWEKDAQARRECAAVLSL